MDTAERFWSDKTRLLKPYIPGEQPRDRTLIKLNTNENPYGPAPEAAIALKNYPADQLRLYPDPENIELRDAIADYYGLPINSIFIGNGSDEILAMAFMAFYTGRKNNTVPGSENSARIYFFDITYSFYPVYSQLFDIPYALIPLDDNFGIDPSSIPTAGDGLVIANPNAPTGRALNLQQIEEILQANRDRLVLVDEAYIDFGGESAVPLIGAYDNLLIVQTFSKSRSMAGLRVGYAMGSPELIEALRRVRDSFNSYTVDRLAQMAAKAAINSGQWFEETRSRIIFSREKATAALKKMNFTVIDSAANFIFISHRTVHAQLLYQELRKMGILVRHFQQQRIDNYLRVSIGTEEEMDQFIRIVAGIIADYDNRFE